MKPIDPSKIIYDPSKVTEQERYPTRYLKWKNPSIQRLPHQQDNWYWRYSGSRRHFDKSVFLFSPTQNLPDYFQWIEAETYETALAKENEWEPLGDGWVETTDEDALGWRRSYSRHGFKLVMYAQGIEIDCPYIGDTVYLPIELATAERINGIIEDIKQLKK